MADQERFKFFKTNTTTWATPHQHRGYTASIALASSTYTLTIVGSGAPAAAGYPSLRAAKNAFRKFLLAKPVA